MSPDFALGEVFTDGRLSIENGSIYEFLNLILGHQPAALSLEPNASAWLAVR